MAGFAERMLRKTKNVGGDALAYGLAPVTVGASLLGKDKYRDKIGGDSIYRMSGNVVDSLTGEAADDRAAEAANRQKAAGLEANSILKDYLDKTREDQRPFYEIGLENAQELNSGMKSGAFDAPAYQDPGQFSYSDPGQFQYKDFDPSQVINDPGYQMRLREGIGGLENSAAARGTLRSGGTLKALTRFNQDLASQEIDKAYGRYSSDRGFQQSNWNANRNFGYGQAQDTYSRNYSRAADQYNRGADASANRFSRLSQLAGYGPAAAAQTSQAQGNYAQGVGNNLMGIANAQGAAAMYGANARAQGLQNVINTAGTIGGMFK